MKQFKHPVYLTYIVLITLAFVFSLSTFAQKIERRGNTFVEQVDSSKKVVKEPKKTEYTYTDKKGNVYPIFLSSTGKAFIIRTSKKTGKEYRQYLPEVTKQLQK